MRSISPLPVMAIILALALVGVSACGGRTEDAADSGDGEPGERMEAGEQAEGEAGGEHAEGGETGEGREHGEGGEHAEGDEHGEGGEGEEGGEYVARADTWDATRRGVRLTLAFDEESGAFVGTAENTSEGIVCAVRVEVHLAGGSELGPTEPRDLGPGESAAVELSAGGEDFDSWTAHPETSACGDV